MKQIFEGKSILIIGGTGTIGKELLSVLLRFKPRVVRIYSRDEYKQFLLQDEFKEYANIRYLIGDVRDGERLSRAMQGIDIVFNLAAMKHVPASEYNPYEAVKTNVMGVQNTIEAAIQNSVKKVVYTSSDKAVSPTNTMGATKLLAERLISSADYSKGGQVSVFSAVRFGNVLGSRGSVIPLWREQIRNRKCITLTEPEMTRFMMSIGQSVELVLKCCYNAIGGEVFVLKMPVMRLGDLAEVVIEEECGKLGIPTGSVSIEKVGLRPGEKLFEELMTVHESMSAVEYEDMFSILPHHKSSDISKYGIKRAGQGEYSSHTEPVLTQKEIRQLLLKSGVI